jgi:hypothetical protein
MRERKRKAQRKKRERERWRGRKAARLMLEIAQKGSSKSFLKFLLEWNWRMQREHFFIGWRSIVGTAENRKRMVLVETVVHGLTSLNTHAYIYKICSVIYMETFFRKIA